MLQLLYYSVPINSERCGFVSTLSNLSRDEEIITRGSLSWFFLVPRAALALFFLFSGFLGLVREKDLRSSSLLILIAILIMAPGLIKMKTTELVLTSRRLYGHYGLINTKTLDTPLNKINTVSVSSGLWGKLFGYGTIHTTSSSGEYRFTGLQSPNVFRDAVMDQIDRFERERSKQQAMDFADVLKMR